MCTPDGGATRSADFVSDQHEDAGPPPALEARMCVPERTHSDVHAACWPPHTHTRRGDFVAVCLALQLGVMCTKRCARRRRRADPERARGLCSVYARVLHRSQAGAYTERGASRVRVLRQSVMALHPVSSFGTHIRRKCSASVDVASTLAQHAWVVRGLSAAFLGRHHLKALFGSVHLARRALTAIAIEVRFLPSTERV